MLTKCLQQRRDGSRQLLPPKLEAVSGRSLVSKHGHAHPPCFFSAPPPGDSVPSSDEKNQTGATKATENIHPQREEKEDKVGEDCNAKRSRPNSPYYRLPLSLFPLPPPCLRLLSFVSPVARHPFRWNHTPLDRHGLHPGQGPLHGFSPRREPPQRDDARKRLLPRPTRRRQATAPGHPAAAGPRSTRHGRDVRRRKRGQGSSA